jgi:hypothetical protein
MILLIVCLQSVQVYFEWETFYSVTFVLLSLIPSSKFHGCFPHQPVALVLTRSYGGFLGFLPHSDIM